MWIWREDRDGTADGYDRPAAAQAGWQMDHHGRWAWRERAPYELADPGRPALALLPPQHPEPYRRGEETPIFHAVNDAHTRRARSHPLEGAPSWAAIPEPHPGSGPLPVQDGWSSGLAPVPTVPPPARGGEGVGHDDVVAESPEEELRRRARRRRRPLAEAERGADAGPGRHALRDRAADGGRAPAPRTGRHALG